MKALLLTAGLALAASPVFAKTNKDIVDIAASNKNFSTLVSLVKQAGLVDALKGAGPLTVFAPTNDAFAKLPSSLVEKLGQDKELLKSVLLYHVAAGSFSSQEFKTIRTIDTLANKPIFIKKKRGVTFINNFKTRIAMADIRAKNGVIQVIDTVLIPGQAQRYSRMISSKPSIADVVTSDPRFSTLKVALEKADLLGAVASMKGITVFAPTNDAFAKIPGDALNDLLANKKQLQAVLLYHVVKGKGTIANLKKAKAVKTLNGQKVRLNSKQGTFFLNNSRVISSDVILSTGVVQVIDTVLIPKM